MINLILRRCALSNYRRLTVLHRMKKYPRPASARNHSAPNVLQRKNLGQKKSHAAVAFAAIVCLCRRRRHRLPASSPPPPSFARATAASGDALPGYYQPTPHGPPPPIRVGLRCRRRRPLLVQRSPPAAPSLVDRPTHVAARRRRPLLMRRS